VVTTTPARRAAARSLLVVSVAGAVLAAPGVSHADTRTLAEKMHDLRVCESSNNYRTNTGNGYYGAYQFAKTTWHGLGFSGRPDLASKDSQDTAARRLHRQQGWRPWPSCARQEHLYG
jgi:hypothetical protein